VQFLVLSGGTRPPSGPQLWALTFQFPGQPSGGQQDAQLRVGEGFAGMEPNRPGAHIQRIVEIDFGPLMGVGRNENDASLVRALQVGHQEVGQQEGGQVVHLAVPLEAILGGHLGVGKDHAGIVHQHIDPLEFRHQLAGKVMDTAQGTQVQVAGLHEVSLRRIVIRRPQGGATPVPLFTYWYA